MKWCLRTLGSALVLLAIACCSTAQTPMMDVSRLAQIPAVSGYEQTLIEEIRTQLRSLSPKTDNLGNLWISFGSGSPHRLLATSVDEPGYVVSEITPDGFLRVQRLPQAAPNPAHMGHDPFRKESLRSLRRAQRSSSARARESSEDESPRRNVRGHRRRYR